MENREQDDTEYERFDVQEMINKEISRSLYGSISLMR